MAASTVPSVPRPTQVRATGGGLGGAVAAEWTKLWGLRSTWACLALTLLGSAVIALLGAYSYSLNAAEGMSANMLTPTVVMLPQFAVVALASLVITGEYATGAVRTTLTTVPRRGTALAAKSLVAALITAVTGALCGLVTVAAGWVFFGSDLQLEAAGLTHGVLGTACYFAAVALFVLGLGAVLRSTAGTVTATIGLLVGVPMAAALIGNDTLTTIGEYTPSQAGTALIGSAGQPYDWPTALVVLAAWAVGGLLVGYALLRGRDA